MDNFVLELDYKGKVTLEAVAEQDLESREQSFQGKQTSIVVGWKKRSNKRRGVGDEKAGEKEVAV